MTLNEYQRRARVTAIYPGSDTAGTDYGILYTALGLANESGEVAGKVKKWMRDGTTKKDLRDKVLAELSDVLWYMSELARQLEIDLDDVATYNLEKLSGRAARGTLTGSGDER